MTSRTCLSIILAAGEGKRMKSSLPKVLHKIASLPLVCHVTKTIQTVGNSDIALIVGRNAEEIETAVKHVSTNTIFTSIQKDQLGTAHAVLTARQIIARGGYDDILIVFGDTPLIEDSILHAARRKLAAGADIVVIGFRPTDPTGYGRLIENHGKLVAIREEREATEEEKRIGFCNSGLMALQGSEALSLLDAVKNDNASHEYYLTEIVRIAHAHGKVIEAIEAPTNNVVGINNCAELAEAETIWQNRKRRAVMLAGVTLIAPETVFFSHDTVIGTDTIIEPNVFFGPGVSIASGVVIRAFSHLEGAEIGPGAVVGPFARIRLGTHLAKKAKVGNFCEIKNTLVAEGAKINHLTYLGDASVGAEANIGAGTITCNYDGYHKSRTEIGKGAFIGSNTSLVAPISIGANAYVASGSVITDNVPDDALAFGRARQVTKEGRAIVLRKHHTANRTTKSD